MSKFDKATLIRWRAMAHDWVLANTSTHAHDITTGSDAWYVAHNCGITREAYADRNVTDAHIVTALKSIFPNAVFKDKYRY